MTEQHPITPPDELVEQWRRDALKSDPTKSVAQCIATQAARWGADQELEACISAILSHPGFEQPELFVELLRASRRPKPKSQVEEALDLLDRIEYNHMTKNLGNEKAWDIKELESVRAALERLRKLEKSND